MKQPSTVSSSQLVVLMSHFLGGKEKGKKKCPPQEVARGGTTLVAAELPLDSRAAVWLLAADLMVGRGKRPSREAMRLPGASRGLREGLSTHPSHHAKPTWRQFQPGRTQGLMQTRPEDNTLTAGAKCRPLDALRTSPPSTSRLHTVTNMAMHLPKRPPHRVVSRNSGNAAAIETKGTRK